jgi:hypothetical protein
VPDTIYSALRATLRREGEIHEAFREAFSSGDADAEGVVDSATAAV